MTAQSPEQTHLATLSASAPTVMPRDPAAIAAAESAKQRLQAALVVAKQFPRDIDQARHRILQACKRPRFAEAAEYAKPMGRDEITGPSIRMAELCLREWGNVQAESLVVFEDDDMRRILVTVIDLETNTRFTKEIGVGKTVERRDGKGREVVSQRRNTRGDVVYRVRATDDELLTKEAALIAKALRNEGLRCIPQDILEEAMDTCRATRSGAFQDDPEDARRKLLDAFTAIRISPAMLEDYLGHKATDISLDEWDDLRKLYRGLKEGSTKWRDILDSRQAKRGRATKPIPSASVDEAPDTDPTRGVQG